MAAAENTPVILRFLAATALLVSWSLGSTGCSRSCEEARDAVAHRLYDECGLECDGCTDGFGPCSEERRSGYECELSCYDGVSCAAFRGEGPDGPRLAACLGYCAYLIYPALPEPSGQ